MSDLGLLVERFVVAQEGVKIEESAFIFDSKFGVRGSGSRTLLDLG
jgi:hypothetical protein